MKILNPILPPSYSTPAPLLSSLLFQLRPSSLGPAGVRNKGQEVLLTDTVGFISKLPTDLIAAFR